MKKNYYFEMKFTMESILDMKKSYFLNDINYKNFNRH